MADDRRLRISTSRTHPDEVARHTFGTTRRGFDPAEVRAYLELIAGELVVAMERERELQELVAEAEHRAANPVLDEATLTASLGQETARVLRSAHDAAADVLSRAEGEAELLRTTAVEEASALRERAEQVATERTGQVEAATAELKRRAQEEATAALEKARLEAEALLTQARAECRAMVQEAQELRAKVLADLTRRRRVLHSQIEQLRAGRERLAETITGVRSAVDVIADDLFRAEDEARLAAEEAGRQAAASAEAEGEVDEGALVAAVPAGAPGDAAVSAAGEAPPADMTTPPEAEAEVEEEDEETRKAAVEELFARLRAGRSTEEAAPAPGGAVTETAAQPADGPEVAVGAVGEPAPEAVSAPAVPKAEPKKESKRAAAKAAIGSRAAATGAQATDAQTTDTQTTPAEAAAEAPAEPAAEAPAEQLDPDLARRDELLRPVITSMTRRLKRALQDDQNDILDRLRGARRWGPDVLPSVEDHLARYSAAAADHLREAAGSGALFAGASAPDAPDVHELSNELALAIVVPLRRRLDGDETAADAGDDALADRVGAAFREWKGARVERLAGDQAVAAFGRATLAVLPSGSTLRWVVDDGGAECPDCDDNSLAGATPRGEAFPTGHAHPPAHAGCRCLIAPVTT